MDIHFLCFADVIIRWTGEMFYVEYWMYRFAWNGHMQWHLTINDGVTTHSKGMCGNHNRKSTRYASLSNLMEKIEKLRKHEKKDSILIVSLFSNKHLSCVILS